ncbi:hypothetical protein GCM10023189_14390 [Nibrella saemangeumensis]|uniref:Uncharacterized protein n=1 Tax=Nibrella saemangeumensis TaxID=1084526 RepID=A0ABP8MJU5_9BACT
MADKKLSVEGQRLVDGMRLAVKRVIEQAKRNDEELVVWRDGKVVRLKAKEL